MKNVIVTTTINPPTEAILKFDAMEDWQLIVVGDEKTPHDAWRRLDKKWIYLSPRYVGATYPDLVKLIGWNSIRLGRMVGFIEAYKCGAEIIASIDDDCIPDDNWGKDVVLGTPMPVQIYGTENELCLDPLYCVNLNDYVWARGFPLELLDQRLGSFDATGVITPLVRVDFCRGQGDIDAISRLRNDNEIIYTSENFFPFSPWKFSPINTQNTFIHRSAIRDFYANIPFIGRADDIWAGYIFQQLHPQSTIYCAPSAKHVQERSVQSIVNDLEDEILMYKETLSFLRDMDRLQPHTDAQIDWILESHSNHNAVKAVNLYRSYFK